MRSAGSTRLRLPAAGLATFAVGALAACLRSPNPLLPAPVSYGAPPQTTAPAPAIAPSPSMSTSPAPAPQGNAHRCDRNGALGDGKLWKNPGSGTADVQVWTVADGSAIGFQSGMAVCADGAPNAYHEKSGTGLDALGNAGHTGNWWGLVTDKDDQAGGDGKGEPLKQGAGDPFPGYYISKTAASYADAERSDWRKPSHYVDAGAIPYVVLPSRLGGARFGDFAAVMHRPGTREQRLAFAIFAEVNDSQLGEGSIALLKALGLPADPRKGGVTADVAYVVFPGSRPDASFLHHTADELRALARQHFDAWGRAHGAAGGEQLFFDCFGLTPPG